MLQRLLLDQGKEIVQSVIDRAKEGDRTAQALCMERLIPRLKDVPELPVEQPQEDPPSNANENTQKLDLSTLSAEELAQFERFLERVAPRNQHGNVGVPRSGGGAGARSTGITRTRARCGVSSTTRISTSSAVANERLLMAGNRCGKTTAGAYELTLHLTGEYPAWWEGKRFEGPIDAWAAGDTLRTVRDIIQLELLGPQHARGTGMIPGDAIIRMTTARGVADAVDSVFVRHVSGGISVLGFKSYAEGRECFQGTSRHVIWIDEEAPMPVYVEALMRTMTVNGIVMVTFTPLNGHTELVQSFLDACT